MFSGKTGELVRRLRAAREQGRRVVAAKPEVDERFGSRGIVSHDRLSYPAEPITAARSLVDVASGADVLGVDELQFLPLAAFEELARVREAGVRVIVAGLDEDYRGVPFEVVASVEAIADDVERRRGRCAVCGEPSTRTQRLLDGEPTPVEGPRILVGSGDIYQTRCDLHFVPPAAAAAALEARRLAASSDVRPRA
jgi:thymidine kinase